jgi:hypothetical protein
MIAHNLGFSFYRQLRNDHICFAYQGNFTDEMTHKIISLCEYNITNKEDVAKMRKKVSFLMAESFQNIVRHMDGTEASSETVTRPGMFLARSFSSSYYIISANVIQNSRIDHVSSKLEQVNSLGPDQLKDLYVEMLTTGEISDKGGAGLGFIEMARKSGHKLQYEFQKVNEEFSFFYLGIQLGGTQENPGNDLLDLGKGFHKELSDHDVQMLYKGDFSQESILPLLKVVEDNLATNERATGARKRVFFVLVELLKNMSKHGQEKDGIFFIGRKGAKYWISCGNYIDEKSSVNLKGQLDHLTGLSLLELNDLYKKTKGEDLSSESGNVGLGLIEIARSCSEKPDYSFCPDGDNRVFYSMNLTV